jgi:hypothetical protein
MNLRLSLRWLVLLVIAALLASLGLASAQDGVVPSLGQAEALGGAPSVVSYQGQVTVGGSPCSGPGYFKLAIVNQAGNTTYWSNDGTSSGGGQPADAVALTVSSGLFNVLLGDTTLAHMTALPASVFSGTDRWLRVWFSSDGSTFVQLSPDRRIAAVPYALQAEDAGTLDGFDSTRFQLRISDACTVGSTIRSVNADGTVVCEAHDARPVFTRADVPVDGFPHAGTSVTIGTDGLPVISYQGYDGNGYVLGVLHCGNLSCTADNTVTTVDTSESVGSSTSITVGSDGLPIVAYYDELDLNLKVLHCGNVECSAGNTMTTADSSGDVGENPSITIGADGLPLVTYSDRGSDSLKMLHCGNAACTAGNTLTLNMSSNHTGQYSSVTTGADGLPVISCYDWYNGDLRVLHCGNMDCTAANSDAPADLDGDVGKWNSITIGTDGLPVISYFDSTGYDLKVLHCGNAACTAGNTATTVDSTGVVGHDSAITIGADGLPLVAYYDDTNSHPKVLHCGNIACTANNVATTVESSGAVGSMPSIAIGTDSLPVIACVGTGTENLRVVHCSNPFCIPYWRPR